MAIDAQAHPGFDACAGPAQGIGERDPAPSRTSPSTPSRGPPWRTDFLDPTVIPRNLLRTERGLSEHGRNEEVFENMPTRLCRLGAIIGIDRTCAFPPADDAFGTNPHQDVRDPIPRARARGEHSHQGQRNNPELDRFDAHIGSINDEKPKRSTALIVRDRAFPRNGTLRKKVRRDPDHSRTRRTVGSTPRSALTPAAREAGPPLCAGRDARPWGAERYGLARPFYGRLLLLGLGIGLAPRRRRTQRRRRELSVREMLRCMRHRVRCASQFFAALAPAVEHVAAGAVVKIAGRVEIEPAFGGDLRRADITDSIVGAMDQCAADSDCSRSSPTATVGAGGSGSGLSNRSALRAWFTARARSCAAAPYSCVSS